VPGSVDERSGIGLKSHARRMLRMGTTVPPSAAAGAVEPASATTTGTAQRVSVEIAIDTLSIILVRTAEQPRLTRRYALHERPWCDLQHSADGHPASAAPLAVVRITIYI
jgi:hypothetical protein